MSDIRQALEACLPNCRWKVGEHRYHILPPNGGPAYFLSKGEHGKGDRAEIERGHVKKMARQFNIYDCMRVHLSL